VQHYRIIPDFDLFLQEKNGGPSPRVVDRARVAGPRWTRDRDRAARSPEHGSPALQNEGFGGRFNGEARPAVVKDERRR
jgi:hypothetical protein